MAPAEWIKGEYGAGSFQGCRSKAGRPAPLELFKFSAVLKFFGIFAVGFRVEARGINLDGGTRVPSSSLLTILLLFLTLRPIGMFLSRIQVKLKITLDRVSQLLKKSS